MAYFAGKFGSVSYNGGTLCADNWELSVDQNNSEVSNFCIGIQQAFIPNLTGGTVTMEGPVNTGGVKIPNGPTVGETYCTLVLGVGPGLGFTVNGLITNQSFTQDIQEHARFSMEVQITPALTLAS